jgi:hypothetical protein
MSGFHEDRATSAELVITPAPAVPYWSAVPTSSSVINDILLTGQWSPFCVCGRSSRKPWCEGTHKVIAMRLDQGRGGSRP